MKRLYTLSIEELKTLAGQLMFNLKIFAPDRPVTLENDRVRLLALVLLALVFHNDRDIGFTADLDLLTDMRVKGSDVFRKSQIYNYRSEKGCTVAVGEFLKIYCQPSDFQSFDHFPVL